MVLLPLPGRSPSPSPKSWSSGPTPSPPRARSRPRAPRSFSRPPRRLFPERPASSFARILSSARCMASRARSVCPPSSASMPSLASELQLPPLRPRRSISSSSSRSFWGEISGERPLMSDLDLRNTILYCVVVKSDWRSGNRSTCSSNRSRSSPFFRKLLKSGRWFDSAVSLKIAERSPAVDPPPVPVRCAKSRSSNDGRLRGSLGSGRDRSAVISVLARSSCCSCSADGVKSRILPVGRWIAGARTSAARPRTALKASTAAARRAPQNAPRRPQCSARRTPTCRATRRTRTSIACGWAMGPLPCSAEKDFFTAGCDGLCSLDDLPDQRVGVHSLGLALEVQDDPVTQRGRGECLDVLHAHVVSALREGPHLAAEHERLGATWAGAVPHKTPRDLGGAGPGRGSRHHAG